MLSCVVFATAFSFFFCRGRLRFFNPECPFFFASGRGSLMGFVSPLRVILKEDRMDGAFIICFKMDYSLCMS